MKKSLVLAMAMALGVTASAYAANPFSDVPAGHWAYDSVAKLAAAGVVDGYADGAFDGDKLMTRYEMAQIVAKAMAKGANVDKLAAEFADELDTLGVRVAKLEKGADAVKITGEVRYAYSDDDTDLTDKKGKGLSGNYNKLRSRIWMAGQINDDWTYTAMLQNEADLTDDDAEEDTNWQRAYLNGKLGGMKVLAGRYNLKVAEGNVYDHRFDGVQLSYGKDVKLTAGYGKANATSYDEVTYANAATKLGVVAAEVGYYDFKDDDHATANTDATTKATQPWLEEKVSKKIWTAAVNMPVAKDLKFGAMWLNGDAQPKADEDGYVLTLAYKGAKATVPGSWGLEAKWYDQPAATYVDHTMDGYADKILADAAKQGYDGFEGYSIAATYALAKNIVAKVQWYDLETREKGDTAETLWGQVVFTF
ncbi:MAG: S-layer homology domain-containing protein [Acidaminococcaceae bacterium]|nr:S-layer homology domain-containing protein [Acidaminococcaceae bacterium]